MSARDPNLPDGANQVVNDVSVSEPVFSMEQRALLRRQLGPDAAARARVRSALWSSVGTGALTPAAQRVDALMHAHAAGATAAKAAAGVMHTFTAKLVVLGLVVASGTTAVVLRGPSEQPRPAALAPVAVRVSELATPGEPGVPALQAEPADSRVVLQPVAAGDVPAEEGRAVAPLVAAGTRSRVSSGRRHGARGERSSQLKAAEVESVTSTSKSRADVPEATAALPAPEAQPPVAASGPAAAAAQTPAPEPPALRKHQLERELTLVRAASDALQRAGASAALLKLQQYQMEFPRGALRVEADALRAIALCTSHAAIAAAVSDAFLKAHASSPLAERVRRACDKR